MEDRKELESIIKEHFPNIDKPQLLEIVEMFETIKQITYEPVHDLFLKDGLIKFLFYVGWVHGSKNPLSPETCDMVGRYIKKSKA